MTTGEKIKTARQNSGYTQEQLAEKLSVSRQAVAKWEADRGVPDIENLKAIAAFFDFSVDDLVKDEVVLEQKDEVADEESTADEDSYPQQPQFNNTFGKPKSDIFKKIFLPIIAGVTALVLIIVIFCTAIPAIKRNSTLKRAQELMNKGHYAAAAEILEGLDTEKATELYNACIYAYAKELYDDGDYENAILKIDSITYKDSAKLANTWKYEFALYSVKKEDYPKAIELFKELGKYKDSDKKYEELCNFYGTLLYNEKKFSSAATYLGNFSSDSELYKKAKYNEGVDLHNEGNYGAAFNLFNSLGKNGNVSAAQNSERILDMYFRRANIWELEVQNHITSLILLPNTTETYVILQYFENESDSEEFTWVAAIDKAHDGYETRMLGLAKYYEKSDLANYSTFTFYFLNNNRVRIHQHTLNKPDECRQVVCGVYNSQKAIDFSSYTTKFEYDFAEVELPELSFAKEVSDTATNKNQEDESDKTNSNSENKNDNEKNNTNTSSGDKTSSDNNTDSGNNTGSNNGSSGSNSNPCANGHSWKEATCSAPATCSVCKKTSGSALAHNIDVTKCRNCSHTDFSKIAKTYTNVSAYDATTGEDYTVQNVSISSSGVFSFTFKGQKYNLKLVQKSHSSSYQTMVQFDCYVNGAKEPDAIVEVDTEYYIPRLTWKYLQGCHLYIFAE